MFGLPKLLEQDVMQSTLFTVISLTYYPSENYLNIQNRALDVIIQSKFCLVMPMTQITLENVDYNVDCFENAFNSQKKLNVQLLIHFSNRFSITILQYTKVLIGRSSNNCLNFALGTSFF